MAESKEYETVLHCSRDLETALKGDRDVVYYLHKEGFITDDLSEQILDSSSWTAAEKAGRLVAKIRDKIKLKSQEYHKLVGHFTQNRRQYGTIVDTLNTYYGGTGGLTTRKHGLEESDNGEPRPKKPRNIEIDGSEEEPEMEMPRFNEEEQKELFEEHTPEIIQEDDKIKEIKLFCEDIQYLILTFNRNEYQAGLTYLKPPSEDFKTAIIHPKPGMVVGLLAERVKVALMWASQGADVLDDVKLACASYPKIKYIIGAGVCYAFDHDECKLADVLISQKIADFTNTKIDEKEGDYEIKIIDRGDHKKIDADLERLFLHDDIPLRKYKVSKKEKGRSYTAKTGLFITPTLLVNSKRFRDALHAAAPEAVGGEMEGGELMKSIYLRSFKDYKIEGVIIIKGVCDYADGKKDKKWQFTAAMAAFNYIEQKMSKLPQY